MTIGSTVSHLDFFWVKACWLVTVQSIYFKSISGPVSIWIFLNIAPTAELLQFCFFCSILLQFYFFKASYFPFIIYTIISPHSMQFLVLSFIAIHRIDIRSFLQHVTAAVNSDPRSPNACFSFTHPLMPEFNTSVLCLIIENIEQLFPGWNLWNVI